MANLENKMDHIEAMKASKMHVPNPPPSQLLNLETFVEFDSTIDEDQHNLMVHYLYGKY